jgi:hypothetical protein
MEITEQQKELYILIKAKKILENNNKYSTELDNLIEAYENGMD